MLDIDNLLLLENTMQPVINKIKAFENFIFYGLGGDLKALFKNYISWLGNPTCIIDKSYHGENYNGIPVIASLSDFIERYGHDFCVVITAPAYHKEIANECRKFLKEDAIFEHIAPLCQTGSNYRDYVSNHKKDICDFYSSLSDDISKTTLENQIAGKISNDLRYFANVCIPGKYDNKFWFKKYNTYPSLYKSKQAPYFPEDIFTMSESEVFFDCGAFDGDTFMDFQNETKGKYDKVVCIECDPASFGKLEESLKKYKNVTCLNAGVWNEDSFMKITATSSQASSISLNKSGEGQEIPLMKIDSIVTDLKAIPTYIKMDIEGSELMALIGAKNTIINYKPKLAVCLYHKKEDIVEIPAYLHSIRVDYKFYLRKYQVDANGLVLFAV